MWQILSLIAGVLAVTLYVACFQLKNRKSIIICNILSRVFYVLQYCFLGSFTGAVMDISAMPASFVASKKNHPFVKRFKLPIIILVNLIIVTVGLLSMLLLDNGNPLGILSILGVLFETIALWFTKENHIRIVSLLGAPCWFVYNMLCGAYASAVGSVLTIISIIVALVRYKKN